MGHSDVSGLVRKKQMKIIVFASLSESLLNFRKQLLVEMVSNGHEVTAFAPGEDREVTTQLRELGIAYHPVSTDRTGLNPLSDIRTCIELFSLFRKYKPDILLNYTIKPVIYGSITARLAGVRRIFSIITGLGYTFSKESLGEKIIFAVVRRLYISALAGNHTVFFQNPDDMKLFTDYNIITRTGQSVLINGSGVDLQHFRLVALPQKRPVFLLIARLIRTKGIREFVEAASIVKQRHPNASFRLLGPYDSNPSAIQKNEVSSWIREGIIEYLGEAKDVRKSLADADVYVLPSYREGTPRSVLEAMAMGRPIITSDAPGCRETVQQGVNGFLVPIKDAKSLAAAMEKFIDHPQLIVSMGKRSRERAEEKYDVHKVNAVILEAMSLLKRK
jgi:glycosyltransferase involved in cell wall biosynthesis